jgi:hypothetical protein
MPTARHGAAVQYYISLIVTWGNQLPMLTLSEKAEAERVALQKCASLEDVLTAILYAGFEGETPFRVHDRDGNLWRVPAHEMTVAEILAFVHHHYGEAFVTICKQHSEFIVH